MRLVDGVMENGRDAKELAEWAVDNPAKASAILGAIAALIVMAFILLIYLPLSNVHLGWIFAAAGILAMICATLLVRRLAPAVQALRADLVEDPLESLPPPGVALQEEDPDTDVKNLVARLDEDERKIKSMYDDLEKGAREEKPGIWARTMIAIGRSLSNLAQEEMETNHPILLERADVHLKEALECLNAASEIFTRERTDLAWARIQRIAAEVYLAQGLRGKDAASAESTKASLVAIIPILSEKGNPEEVAYAQDLLRRAQEQTDNLSVAPPQKSFGDEKR